MNKIGVIIIIISFTIIMMGVLHLVEKNFKLFQKILKIQYVVFIPIFSVLTIIDLIKYNDLLGKGHNFYGLSLFMSLFLFFSEKLLRFIINFFPCYSKYRIDLSENNFRYVNFISIANLLMLFLVIITLLNLIGYF